MPYSPEQSATSVADAIPEESEISSAPPDRSARDDARAAAPRKETNAEPRGGLVGNLLVVAFLAAIVSFGIRSLVVKDNRFGWGMFNHQINYVVNYEWVLADGTTIPCPTDELRGTAAKKLAAGETHVMLYGIGGLRLWIGNYLERLYNVRRPAEATRVRATLAYAVNPVDFSNSPRTIEFLEHPAPAKTERAFRSRVEK